jgi:hypothetical protein
VIERAALGRIIRDDKFRLMEPSGPESTILDIDNAEPRELTLLPLGGSCAGEREPTPG